MDEIKPGDEAFVSCRLDDSSVRSFHLFPFETGYVLLTWLGDDEPCILCEDVDFEFARVCLELALPKGDVFIDLIE